MCLAIPGKIVEIKNDIAVVDYGNRITIARIARSGYNLGDYVLVQNKLVVEKVPKEQVEEFLK